MKMNEEQQKKVIEILNKSWITKQPCAICGHSDWEIQDRLFEMREYVGGGLQLGGGSNLIPFVVVRCKKCSNSLFFNVVPWGIMEPKEEKKQDGKQRT